MMKERGWQKNSSLLQADMEIARNRRFIIPQDESTFEKGQFSPKYFLNPVEFTKSEQNEDMDSFWEGVVPN